ncbi:MAG: 6-bladed beta-propeller [Bacteroidales bacterium]
MALKGNKPKLTLLITTLVMCSIWSNAVSQESKVNLDISQADYPKVVWIKSWPSDNNGTHKKIKDRLNSIVFGIKPRALSNPISVFASTVEDYWVLDQGGNTIFQVEKELGEIPQSVRKADLVLSSLVGICLGPNSSILFTDSKTAKIYNISPGNKKLTCLNDSLVLEQPTGIAYSAERKEIWVVETKAHRISVLTENGELIRRIGNRGNAPGEFNYPTHIWIDKKGYAYITDALNFRIQVIDATGKVISVFGEAGDGSGYLARPKGIATDSIGNIYVVDALFHVVQVFDIKGNFLYKFGNQGHGDGEFWMPNGIFIDDKNYIYIADTYNSRVQIFKLIQPASK